MMLERYPEKMVDGTPPKSLFREIWGVTRLCKIFPARVPSSSPRLESLARVPGSSLLVLLHIEILLKYSCIVYSFIVYSCFIVNIEHFLINMVPLIFA